MNGTTVLGLVTAGGILILLFEMMRRRRLREKYAVLWATVAFAVVLLAVFPVILTEATDLLGLQLPSNLLFFGASVVILAMTLQHSSELGRLEERTRTLAEELALLRLELQQESQSVTDSDADADADA
ncbi:DUF2304 domain-containing protein [Nocardioides albidus]|uniref:DUF2304 domain-containing protein n=1 Tax=Nocardioides albidus TaxID=1517589 RepID=A0A5C4W5L1_9ACTN|nr:DUF2304 domain-containing protein [Nocardioides albidus]TNM42769.1 DUF2304 domain-containing protein [Nocardioides albidus]